MKKIAVLHKPGDIIELVGKKFVVLDDLGPSREKPEEHNLFILALKSQGKSRLGDTNNYAVSELRHWTAAWLDDLMAHDVAPDLIRTRTIDLTTMDGHGRYGELTVKAAPLTMDEARKYADIIPNCDDDFWLATGWGGPEFFGDACAMLVSTNGYWHSYICSLPHGVRPALVISSFLLSSIDESDQGKIPTDELL